MQKYQAGDPDQLCVGNYKQDRDAQYGLAPYRETVITLVQAGSTPVQIRKALCEQYGYEGKRAVFEYHLEKFCKQEGLFLHTHRGEKPQTAQETPKKSAATISRKTVFCVLWMKHPLTQEHKDYLFHKYPVLHTLDCCIREFREIFQLQSIPRLQLFIERYMNSEIKGLVSFAAGLARDIDAVENAVSSPLSNAFVEGENNRVKMVKRTMYGRCSRKLLEAKIILGTY